MIRDRPENVEAIGSSGFAHLSERELYNCRTDLHISIQVEWAPTTPSKRPLLYFNKHYPKMLHIKIIYHNLNKEINKFGVIQR